MLKIAEEVFEADEKETTFYGWIDPYGHGRKPGLTWDLYVCAKARRLDVRTLLNGESDFEFESPIRDVTPILDFSEIEIEVSDWRSIEGFCTEDCSPFSFYVVDEFSHLSMATCSLSFRKRAGSVFTVEFLGQGGLDDCGVEFSFHGLLDVPLLGIGMYFLPGEIDPVGAGRRLLKQHVSKCDFKNHQLDSFPKGAPPETTRQRLVFSPG